MTRLHKSTNPDIVTKDIDILFPAGGNGKALEKALQNAFVQAEKLILDGATVLVLTDRNASPEKAPIPSLLAGAGLHHHLIRRGLRTKAAIVLETGEPREVMHFALLVGFGVNAVCPYVAYASIRELAENGLLEKSLPVGEAVDKGEPLAVIHHNGPADVAEVAASFTVKPKPVARGPLVIDRIGA